MRLKNYTDIDSDTIRNLIRFVRPSGISNFDVRVSNYSGTTGRGRAYTQGSGYHDRADPFIVISIAPEGRFKRQIYEGGGGYLPHVWGSRMEALVHLLAHELRHLWQAKHTKGKVWGARGRMSERDADAYAIQMLRRFRRGAAASSESSKEKT